MRAIFFGVGLVLGCHVVAGASGDPQLVVLSGDPIASPEGGESIVARSLSAPSVGPNGEIGLSGFSFTVFPGTSYYAYVPADAIGQRDALRWLVIQGQEAPGLAGQVFRPDVGPVFPDENGSSFYVTHFLFDGSVPSYVPRATAGSRSSA